LKKSTSTGSGTTCNLQHIYTYVSISYNIWVLVIVDAWAVHVVTQRAIRQFVLDEMLKQKKLYSSWQTWLNFWTLHIWQTSVLYRTSLASA